MHLFGRVQFLLEFLITAACFFVDFSPMVESSDIGGLEMKVGKVVKNPDRGNKQTSSSSSSLSSFSSSLPRKKWMDALCTFDTGWKHPSAMIDTGFASVLSH